MTPVPLGVRVPHEIPLDAPQSVHRAYDVDVLGDVVRTSRSVGPAIIDRKYYKERPPRGGWHNVVHINRLSQTMTIAVRTVVYPKHSFKRPIDVALTISDLKHYPSQACNLLWTYRC